jgi:hypothetical protein
MRLYKVPHFGLSHWVGWSECRLQFTQIFLTLERPFSNISLNFIAEQIKTLTRHAKILTELSFSQTRTKFLPALPLTPPSQGTTSLSNSWHSTLLEKIKYDQLMEYMFRQVIIDRIQDMLPQQLQLDRRGRNSPIPECLDRLQLSSGTFSLMGFRPGKMPN